jgi:hypothetical protein
MPNLGGSAQQDQRAVAQLALKRRGAVAGRGAGTNKVSAYHVQAQLWLNFSSLNATSVAPTARTLHELVTSPSDGLLYMFAGLTGTPLPLVDCAIC